MSARAFLLALAMAMACLHMPLHAATFGTHLATQHFGSNADHMQTATPGIYVRTDAGLTLGAYRNSNKDDSTYGGWTWQTEDKRFALTAGVVMGYGAAELRPLLIPSTRIGFGNGFAARLSFVPTFVKRTGAVGLHLSIERDF